MAVVEDAPAPPGAAGGVKLVNSYPLMLDLFKYFTSLLSSSRDAPAATRNDPAATKVWIVRLQLLRGCFRPWMVRNLLKSVMRNTKNNIEQLVAQHKSTTSPEKIKKVIVTKVESINLNRIVNKTMGNLNLFSQMTLINQNKSIFILYITKIRD